jgi:hypothetical protein
MWFRIICGETKIDELNLMIIITIHIIVIVLHPLSTNSITVLINKFGQVTPNF